MNIQEIFYWVASIVLALIGIFVVAAIVLLFYLKRLVSRVTLNLNETLKIWRNISVGRFVVRALKLIF